MEEHDLKNLPISIESLWKMIMDTHKEVATLITEYKHISEKINSIDNKVTVLIDHEFRIKNSEKNVSKINEQISCLSKKTDEFEDKFTVMEVITKRKNTFWLYVANNWHKIAIIGGALAAIIDFVYKIDPK